MCIFYGWLFFFFFKGRKGEKRPQQKAAGGCITSGVAMAFGHFPAFFIIRNISNQWLGKGRVKQVSRGRVDHMKGEPLEKAMRLLLQKGFTTYITT